MFKKNYKIKIFLFLFLILNFVLIIAGSILIPIRKENLTESVYETLTSNIMVDYLTEGEYANYEDLKEDLILENSEYWETSKSINEKLFTSIIYWVDIVDLLIMFKGDVNVGFIENPTSIATLIFLDKGSQNAKADAKALLSDLLGIEETGNIYRILNFIMPNGFEGGISIPLILNDSFLIKPIDIFEYNLIFEYKEDGMSETSIYDFSNGIFKGSYLGDETHIGIKAWDKFEIASFTEELGFNTDFSNKNNKTLNFELWKVLSSFENNTKYLWYKYMKKVSDEYFYSTNPYFDYEIKINEENEYYYFQTEKKNNENKKYEIDSIYEAFQYDLYLNLDYSSYFDKAVKEDGVEHNGIKQYNLNDMIIEHNLNSDLQDLIYNEGSNDLNEELNSTLWEFGMEKTTFSNYMIIVENYRPYLRKDSIDDFIWDLSKLITKDIKLSELEKPNNV